MAASISEFKSHSAYSPMPKSQEKEPDRPALVGDLLWCRNLYLGWEAGQVLEEYHQVPSQSSPNDGSEVQFRRKQLYGSYYQYAPLEKGSTGKQMPQNL